MLGQRGGVGVCWLFTLPLPFHCQYAYTCTATNALGEDKANITVHEGGECAHTHTHTHTHKSAGCVYSCDCALPQGCCVPQAKVLCQVLCLLPNTHYECTLTIFIVYLFHSHALKWTPHVVYLCVQECWR